MDMLSAIATRMDFASKRHEVLAGNVANAQTPGYMPKDVISSGFASSLALAKTNAAHLGLAGSGATGQVRIRPGTPDLPSLDGNGVDLDQERALLAQNALDFETQIRFATHYLRQQQTAAS